MPDDREVLGAEERVTLYRCENGHVSFYRELQWTRGPRQSWCPTCEKKAEVVDFLPASLVDDLRSRLEGVEAERDEANEKLGLVRSKTALDVVAENMAAQRRAREAEARAEKAEETLVEAAIPLEVIAGQQRVNPYKELSPGLLDQVEASIEAIRSALLHPEEEK